MPDINEPTEIAQELGEKLKVPNVEFDAWVASMPAKHWSKYDLSACRLGWEAALDAERQKREAAERELVVLRAELGGPNADAAVADWRDLKAALAKANARIAEQDRTIVRLRDACVSAAAICDEWAEESRRGGWSTHQVASNRDLAGTLRRAALTNIEKERDDD